MRKPTALESTRSVIVAWSKSSVISKWVIEEADWGLERKILIPIFIDNVSPPLGFRNIQAADFTNWNSDKASPEFERLFVDISTTVGSSPLRVIKSQKGTDGIREPAQETIHKIKAPTPQHTFQEDRSKNKFSARGETTEQVEPKANAEKKEIKKKRKIETKKALVRGLYGVVWALFLTFIYCLISDNFKIFIFAAVFLSLFWYGIFANFATSKRAIAIIIIGFLIGSLYGAYSSMKSVGGFSVGGTAFLGIFGGMLGGFIDFFISKAEAKKKGK
jgi:hypothetical protein